MKIVIVGGLASSLINFRGDLISSFLELGYDVITMAADSNIDQINEIESLGCRFVPFPIDRSGLNPFSDLKILYFLYRFFRDEQPDLIISYTIKPIIWGGIAARFANVPRFFSIITGLGFAFQEGSNLKKILTSIVKFLYKFSLKFAEGVIFQNADNMNYFIDNNLVERLQCSLVNGSGVDLVRFDKVALSSDQSFLLIARLLGDKGIREYIAAARMVKDKYPNAIFNLVGPEDPSPDGIPISYIRLSHEKGYIQYHGGVSDVKPYLKGSNVFVLPSYHEGMPRTVLEAMAMGRPILTTNVPGCKETVISGVNGWLVDKESVDQLVNRMIWFIENPDKWQTMGDNSHQMAVEKFDVEKVNIELMKIMGLDSK